MSDTNSKKVKITLNGKEIEAPAGQNLLDAADANGVEIPRYCYHPGLSVAGQCRMCMVEVEGNPKLQIGCNIRCSDGLKVISDSEKVKNAVKWSLEYHLVNHPIDCPICDQAGECGLQEYYMEHGQYKSDMHEQKVNKQKVVDLGDHIVLDKERCILCSRCVRFTQEISKTSEFGIFNRGDRSVIGTVDDKPLTGNYQVNTVDICPVGALTSKDFRFEQRVWFLDETESVCSGCSKGCNVFVHHKKGKHIYRLKPRFNEAVNSYWMCDKGRYTYKDSNYDRRLSNAKMAGVDIPYSEAIQTWASDLRVLVATERTDEIGVWISPHHSNEELNSILDTFSGKLKVTKFYSENIEQIVQKDESVDGFLLRSDPYPNSKGFLSTLQGKKVKTQSTDDLIQTIKKGGVSHIVLICPEGQRILPEMLKISKVLSPFQFVIVLTPQLAAMEIFSAALSLPTLGHYEKTGTFINHAGIVQHTAAGFKMFKESHSVTDILNDLMIAQAKPAETRERMAT
ncbi:MAG: (2Fe-2S)-binding protein [Deltaproteobacteria bacterium]|nr:(2Fe-2S)-binding protein [Deltaproteobacteria bacterium]